MTTSLTDRWTLGGVSIPNRVVLAPLAGIGNWFVRLQAKRYGAGLAVSEMVSSFAVHYGNERTCTELLRIHPDEHPVSVQLFGHDPDVMASAAERVAAAGADLIDLNMGCPVPKVCKTGAGAALLDDPDRAVALARAAARGSGLPVTVKLRTGLRPGDRSGVELARRLALDAGVAGLSIHPRHATQRHQGAPDYELARSLVDELPVPVLISGGLHTAQQARQAFQLTGAAGVLLARGSLGNPWLFEQLLFGRLDGPTPAEILAELDWVIDRACEHLGHERAGRYLRKFYPWYIERLAGSRAPDAGGSAGSRALQAAVQTASGVDAARALIWSAVAGDRAAESSGRRDPGTRSPVVSARRWWQSGTGATVGAEMSEDHDTEELLLSQRDLEAAERRRARKSVDEEEARQHERRADKAGYLSEKLEQQVEADKAGSP